MRPSPLRHPLAVLRRIAQISQKELAALVGRSTSAIQAIELKKLALGQELAQKIELETGASMKWLLDGDPSVPPIIDELDERSFLSDKERKFSKAVFERRRADREAGQSGRVDLLDFPWMDAAKLTAIQDAAQDHPDRSIMDYRISKFLEGLEKEFGISKKRFDDEMLKQELWGKLQNLFEDPDSEIGEDVRMFRREFVPSFMAIRYLEWVAGEGFKEGKSR